MTGDRSTPSAGAGFGRPVHRRTPADRRIGAELMYYGGDLAEIALTVVPAAGRYAAGGRALRRRLPDAE